MKAFRAPMLEMGEVEAILEALPKNRGVLQVIGTIDAQKAQLIDTLGADSACRLIVAANDAEAKEIWENISFFDREAMYFPAKDFIFFQADLRSNQLEKERIRVLERLLTGDPVTVVAPVSAFMTHMMPYALWKEQIRTVSEGDVLDLEEWKRFLARTGYERNTQVEGPGQYAVRGGILDIYPLTMEHPVRIELFGDEVDQIRVFDEVSQRSIDTLESVKIFPASELILDEERLEKGLAAMEAEGKKAQAAFKKEMKLEEAARVRDALRDCRERLTEFEDYGSLDAWTDYFYPSCVSLLDWFPETPTVFLDEPNRLAQAADATELEFRESMMHRLEKGYVLPGQTGIVFGARAVQERLSSLCCVGLCAMEAVRGDWPVTGTYSLSVQGVSAYNNHFEMLVRDLKRWVKEKYRVIVMAASRTRGRRLAEDLQDYDLRAFFSEDEERVLSPGEIMVTSGSARRGYEYPLIRFVVITESDIFGRVKRKKRRPARREGTVISSWTDLTPGDYVVHESHGLGVFRGVEKIEVGHVLKDYVKIEYADGGFLYVLASQLDAIQKYADADAKKPKLSRLGTQEWARTKSKVRGAVQEIARELVELYAARQREDGFVYSEDSVWQSEFEELFPFEETEDQIKAIEETKRDMESPRIMDRLICGDVGYGKTEVALRAAFKAVQDSKQTAFLVPTTILAQQHYNTFVQRMSQYPVKIGLLCRFRTSAEQKKTIEDLKRGRIDIVIGTHRLLSKDVAFKDLGLLIIDEEQRFGVTHKEKIKQLKKDVDVLSLTATPIPRTLHMSLTGIRDMSLLEEPPSDRRPIQTFVMEYNEEMVREAVSRELARGGQVYFVYNRISRIAEMAAMIQRLVPDARVAWAHGQMKERQLEDIMYDFINGDTDILVTTTIIETGLDISNVNTIIIYDADNMGLSQLYQLRGRVGRSSRTSFAFLMYRRGKVLRETARKRLEAIREFTELGSGFRIAMRDLEIRGAGNLLGSEQSGHMDAVGYDLYCKLLGEAVREAKGTATVHEGYDTSVDIDVDAYIPDSYIRDETTKLDVYRRIAQISSQEEHDDMLNELIDRFGDPPRPVLNLLQIAMLRVTARLIYVTDVVQKAGEIRFILYPKARIDILKIDQFLRGYWGKMTFSAQDPPSFSYRLDKDGSGEEPLRLCTRILMDMKQLEIPQGE